MKVAVTSKNGQNVTDAEGDVSTIYNNIKNVNKTNNKLILGTNIGEIQLPLKYHSLEAKNI